MSWDDDLELNEIVASQIPPRRGWRAETARTGSTAGVNLREHAMPQIARQLGATKRGPDDSRALDFRLGNLRD
jgi:hypothetical protein